MIVVENCAILAANPGNIPPPRNGMVVALENQLVRVVRSRAADNDKRTSGLMSVRLQRTTASEQVA